MNFLENIPVNMRLFLGGIYGLLIAASAVVALMKMLKPDKNVSELTARIKSWWVMVTIFSIAMVLSKTVSLAFFAFLSFMAFKEYVSIIPTRRADRRVIFWAYLAIPMQYYFIYIGWYGMFIIFIPVYMYLLLPTRMVLIGETKGFLKSMATIQWGLMTMVFSISHVSYFLVLPPKEGFQIGGAGYVLFLVVLTQINDVSQFIWGKTLGKHKIIPKVSPNKTWEGFLGGVVTSVLLAFLFAPVLTELSGLQVLAAGLIISVGGFMGDVSISALKRDLDKKDTGSIIPGHGGILDRIDSLTYTAPLFFHFIRYSLY